MEVLEQFLAGHEDDIFSFSTPELEKFVQLLSDKVQTDREQLAKLKADMRTLETEATERSSEKEGYVLLMGQTVDLDTALSAEAETQEQLLAVSQELERLSEVLQSREAVGDNGLEKPETADTKLVSYEQKEKLLLEERAQLGEMLQRTQTALRDVQLEQRRVDDELLLLQTQSSACASKCPRESEENRLLDACIKDLGLLQILPDVQHNRK